MLSNEWIYPFNKLTREYKEANARGLKTKEIQSFSCSFSPKNWFVPFKTRKLSMKYIAAEFIWYAGGDLSDEFIEKYSSIWASVKSPVMPFWNSNYGHYINPNLERIILTLCKDPSSRQASVMILNNQILNSTTKDTCCTYAINYCIRDNKLISKVHMRSTDLVYGFCNDIPQFGFYQEVVFDMLKKTGKFPELQLGNLNFVTDSLHVYERHFKMLDEIMDEISKTSCSEFEDRINELRMPDITYETYLQCKVKNFDLNQAVDGTAHKFFISKL